MARSDDTTTDGRGLGARRALYDALAPVYDAVGGARAFAMMVVGGWSGCCLPPRAARAARGRAAAGSGAGARFGRAVVPRSRLRHRRRCCCALRALHPGWRLAGVDVSPGMLAIARGKPGSDARALAARAAARAAAVRRARSTSPAAFYDTLNHLPDLDALAATFRAVAALLRPGGLLVFDLNNALGFETWWRGAGRLRRAGHYVAIETRVRRRHTRTGRATIGLDAAAASSGGFCSTSAASPSAEVRAALAGPASRPRSRPPWARSNADSPGKTWFVAAKRHEVDDRRHEIIASK